ncbi:MAG: FmdB family zinc ribbon protein [Solirubrobacterales bacterium]
MPIYEYRCSNGHEFEVFQAMSDDPVTECAECGAPAERVFRPVAVHFKGSGFYTTDYARKSAATASGDGGGTDPGDSKGSKDSKDSKGSNDSGGSGDSKGSKDSKAATTSSKKDD